MYDAKKTIKRANTLSKKRKLTGAEERELKDLLRKHKEEYIYSVYEADMKEYADGAIYTAAARAKLEKEEDDEEEDEDDDFA